MSDDRWLEHRPQTAVPLNTVLQPVLKKRKSITKLTDMKDVANSKTSKYCLMTQEQDSEGDLETHLYKVMYFYLWQFIIQDFTCNLILYGYKYGKCYTLNLCCLQIKIYWNNFSKKLRKSAKGTISSNMGRNNYKSRTDFEIIVHIHYYSWKLKFLFRKTFFLKECKKSDKNYLG